MVPRFTKLASGAWGVCVATAVAPGTEIYVHKRDGSTTKVVIDAVLDHDTETGQRTCSIVKIDGPGSDVPRERICAECGDPAERRRGGHLVRDLEDNLVKHWSCCQKPPQRQVKN